jgi:hypothetical protein
MSPNLATTPRTILSGSWLPYGIACALLVAMFLGSPNFRPASGPGASPFGGDVLQEWIGGYVVRAGDHSRFYDRAYADELEHDEGLVGFEWDAGEYLPLVYPPFYYLLVSPLSCLPFQAAAIVWAGLMAAAYGAAWWIFQKARTGEDAWPTSWLLPLSLLFMPLIENFTTCQKGSVLLLILTGTFFLLQTNRPYSAGLVFGLIAFKPQLALPIAIAMLCKGQWRFVLGGLTMGGMLAALCLVLGLDVCRQYVDFSLHAGEYLNNAGYDLAKSHALSGFFALLLGTDTPATRWLTLVACSGTVAVTALALRGRLDTNRPQFAWQFSALVVATLLLSPHLYTYDLTVLLLPLGLIATRRIGFQPVHNESQAGWQPILPLQWLAVLVFCLVGVSPSIAHMTNVQLSVPLLFALLFTLGLAARKMKASTSLPFEACPAASHA